MISCKFMGRLGNNMFQTATTIEVAERVGSDFVLPTKSHAGHRGDINSDMSGFDYDFKFQDILLPNTFNQATFDYIPVDVKDDLELHGFYQSYKYFDNIRDKLINKYFKFKNEIVDQTSKYKITENSLGISVRRGDYIPLQHNHCVLSMKYYADAFSEILDVNQIFIFSDDIPWCKNNICTENEFDEIVYVEGNPFVQLYMMTQMKNLILSNSTFAWWGGYLNDKKGKIIIPDPWFGPNYKDKDVSGLYIPEWLVQKHEIVLV